MLVHRMVPPLLLSLALAQGPAFAQTASVPLPQPMKGGGSASGTAAPGQSSATPTAPGQPAAGQMATMPAPAQTAPGPMASGQMGSTMKMPAGARTMATPDDGSAGHEPMSNQASNIDPSDTHTTYAPALPTPDVGPNATPRQLLAAAQQALAQKHTGAAQQALEMAETRLLDRTVDPSQAGTPDANPMIGQINQALHLLGHGDADGAARVIGTLLAAK